MLRGTEPGEKIRHNYADNGIIMGISLINASIRNDNDMFDHLNNSVYNFL